MLCLFVYLVVHLCRFAITYKLQGLSFREYLNFFHYYNINSYSLEQIIVQTLETDIPQYANLNVGTSRKLKRLFER